MSELKPGKRKVEGEGFDEVRTERDTVCGREGEGCRNLQSHRIVPHENEDAGVGMSVGLVRTPYLVARVFAIGWSGAI